MLNVYSAGLIVPDLPFEESADLKREAAKKNVDMVGLFKLNSLFPLLHSLVFLWGVNHIGIRVIEIKELLSLHFLILLYV